MTLTEVFKDNAVLCNKVQESEVIYFIQCIEKERDVRFLKFLQTIMKVHGQPIKRAQDLVMAEVINKEVVTRFQKLLDCQCWR